MRNGGKEKAKRKISKLENTTMEEGVEHTGHGVRTEEKRNKGKSITQLNKYARAESYANLYKLSLLHAVLQKETNMRSESGGLDKDDIDVGAEE